ncbi:MAG: MopE-related protein [Myxococcota bacterium]
MLLSLTLLACFATGGTSLSGAADQSDRSTGEAAGGDDTSGAPEGDTGGAGDHEPSDGDTAVDTGTDTGAGIDTGAETDEIPAPCPSYWLDDDADGFGAGAPVVACEPPTDHVPLDGDCDDADAAVFPGAPEVCDAVDQDCDGSVDEHAVDAPTGYADRDGDGFGDDGAPVVVCDGGAAIAGDCDDADATASPAGAEVCGDGVDQDCDGADRVCLWAGSLDVSDADATVRGDTSNMDFGERLADAGDIDGDGFVDLLVAAAGNPTGSRATSSGSVWLFPGSASIAGDTRATTLTELTFATCVDDVSAAGDVDGDGFADVLVGQSCAGAASEGAAHLFYGGPTWRASDTAAQGDAVFEGATAEGRLGDAVAAAGDIDGDGLDDLLLADASSVYLAYGGPTRYAGAVGASTLVSWSGGAAADPGGDAAGITSGDLDGDGLRDLLAFEADGRSSGADAPGELHVLYGDATRYTGAGRLADWDASFVGPAGAGTVGLGQVALAGDLDGDGYDEVIAASPTHQSSRGTVWVFAGSAARHAGDVADTDADQVLAGPAAFAAFGAAATLVPDLDGYDGAELLVGARGYGAWLFHGGARGGTYDTSSADAAFGGGAYVDDLGEGVAAPDLDGDGIPELLLGAPDTTEGDGIVYVFLGTSM